jgi:hypothetical protein
MTARLVVAPNWIGDAVLSLPFVRALRAAHPQDRLAVLARKGPAAIYRSESTADEVLERSPAPARRRPRRALRTIRRGVAASEFFSRRADRVSRRSPAAHRLRDRSPDVAPDARSAAAAGHRASAARLRRCSCVRAASSPTSALRGCRFRPRPSRAPTAHSPGGLVPGARPILLAPGSAKASTKRWPPERFAALGDALALQGWPCGLVVGPDEVDLGARVSAAAAHAASDARRGSRSDRAGGAALARASAGLQRLGPDAPGGRGRNPRGGLLRTHRSRTAPPAWARPSKFSTATCFVPPATGTRARTDTSAWRRSPSRWRRGRARRTG